MVVKKTVTKAPAKLVATKPTITVETRKISSPEACCWTPKSANCCRFTKHFFMIILMVVNTVLLALILVNQTRMEALRAGWSDNYRLLKQVFQTEWYKAQQRQQLEQALQVLSQPQQATAAQGQAVAPTAQEAKTIPTQAQQQ